MPPSLKIIQYDNGESAKWFLLKVMDILFYQGKVGFGGWDIKLRIPNRYDIVVDGFAYQFTITDTSVKLGLQTWTSHNILLDAELLEEIMDIVV